jgi:hypothetical protein
MNNNLFNAKPIVMKKIVAILIALHAFLFTLHAQVINVPADQPTIQAGINAAGNGDLVLVAPGTYYENIRFMGKAITVASHFINSGDTNDINNTIIDGSSQATHPDSAAVVMFIHGEDTSSIVYGFTLTGGMGFYYAAIEAKAGGGVACLNSGAKIQHNKIVNNVVNDEYIAGGGGIAAFSNTNENWVVIENNTINNNQVESNNITSFGGGISCSTSGRISNNKITHNHSLCTGFEGLAWSGGIDCKTFSTQDTVYIINNEIAHNITEAKNCSGSGICLNSSSAHIIKNVIHENLSEGTYCYGSAIYLEDMDGDIYIEDNSIQGNVNQGETVGLATVIIWSYVNPDAFVQIKNNLISGNLAYGDNAYATAIWLKYTWMLDIEINGNIITDHHGLNGSGLYAMNAYNYRLVNNLFSGNSSTAYGGAIWASLYETGNNPNGSIHPLYANNTFVNNYAGEWGGAIYFASTYDSICPVFMNNIFRNNTAGDLDYDLHHNGAEELLMVNNNIDPSRISGTWAGYGNISADPEFLDDSCHIPSWSPCTDAGIDSVEYLGIVYYAPNTDFENEPRPNTGCTQMLIDIGADESVYCPHFTTIPDLVKDQAILNVTIYPNPLSTTTTLAFRLGKPENVQFTVYNVQSQIVYTMQEKQDAGEHKVQWNAEGLPAGMYYFRIQAGEKSGSGKVVKVK